MLSSPWNVENKLLKIELLNFISILCLTGRVALIVAGI